MNQLGRLWAKGVLNEAFPDIVSEMFAISLQTLMDRQADWIRPRNPIDMVDPMTVLTMTFRGYAIVGKGIDLGEIGGLAPMVVTWRQRHWSAHFRKLAMGVKIMSLNLALGVLDLSRASMK